MDSDPLLTGLIFFGVIFVAGARSLMSVRKLDRTNYIIQKATPLPLRLVNEHDDVWLKGVAECGSPLDHPRFGHACLFYNYKVEENVNSNKFKRPSWTTVEESSEAAAFFLRDGEQKIHVDGNHAEFKNLTRDRNNEGSLRHTLNYFPYPSDVNVVGSVSEGKKSLEKRANIPLIVTTKNREDYFRRAETKEAWSRIFGFCASWAGMTGVLVVLSSAAPMFGINPKGPLALAVAAPTIILAFYWSVSKYNTFVNYRNRIDNAWNQIDVDLSMRYELIPKLVECAKGLMKHERELLESLGALRKRALANRESKLQSEGEVAISVQHTIARIEENPDLIAQGTVIEVTQQMHAIEEKIAHGRRNYNESVREYNDTIKVSPQVMIANLFGFAEHTFFSAPEEKAPMPEFEVTDVE